MLFTGIMITASGPKVLEYNARFGDPETQTMMMLLAPDCDLAAVLLACCTEKLENISIPVLTGFACNVVVASGGYPEAYATGHSITMTEACPPGETLFARISVLGTMPATNNLTDVQIFHAGTARTGDGNHLITAGGRVFSVAAHGATLEEAVSLVYRGVQSIQFKDMFYRKDIAARYILPISKSRMRTITPCS